jgi:hypothetical protein
MDPPVPDRAATSVSDRSQYDRRLAVRYGRPVRPGPGPDLRGSPIVLRFSLLLLVLAGLGGVFYTGVWHIFTLFVWQHPMLSWLPVVVAIAVGVLVRSVERVLAGTRRGAKPARPQAGGSEAQAAFGEAPAPAVEQVAATPARSSGSPPLPAAGIGVFAGVFVLLLGLSITLFSPPRIPLDDVEFRLVRSLPERSQPRLLPRAAVRDDPRFADADEIHLARDVATGDLMWTGEWQASFLRGPSSGVARKPLDDLVSDSDIVRAGFDRSASGIAMGTFKWEAKRRHPVSRIQYPVLLPSGEREAIAMAPYSGYRGFPFRTPYLKGVLVYHRDGEIEDLTPQEAARRPELAASGRIVPETVARRQAEALADELGGKIVDGEGNRQPFLTAIDRERTVWMTIINGKQRDEGVIAVVLADSTTGRTDVWSARGNDKLVSTKDVLDTARALPLRWSVRRCCDSDGHSYTVTLREVVEPRMAFKDGEPYYLVTVVPTKNLALGREVEYTLLIDARTGRTIDRFEHVARGPAEDERLQRFFGAAAARSDDGAAQGAPR